MVSQCGSHDQPKCRYSKERVRTESTCRRRRLDFTQDLCQGLPGVCRLVVWQQFVHPVEPFRRTGWLKLTCKPLKDWVAVSWSTVINGHGAGQDKRDMCPPSRESGPAGGYAPWSAMLGDWIVGCDSRISRRSAQIWVWHHV